MPTGALKSMAADRGVSLGRAEHLWDKAKDIAGKEYKYDKKNPRHWALVMGILKKMMGKKKKQSESVSFTEFLSMIHEVNVLTDNLRAIAEAHDADVIDRTPTQQRKEVPLHVPGGATVVVLNDKVTPFEVVIEAIMHGTRLSEAEATRRMMAAHKNGWAAVASYGSRDLAETVAHNIEEHAAHNPNYDHYKPHVPHKGPWPLTCEVLDADQT